MPEKIASVPRLAGTSGSKGRSVRASGYTHQLVRRNSVQVAKDKYPHSLTVNPGDTCIKCGADDARTTCSPNRNLALLLLHDPHDHVVHMRPAQGETAIHGPIACRLDQEAPMIVGADPHMNGASTYSGRGPMKQPFLWVPFGGPSASSMPPTLRRSR